MEAWLNQTLPSLLEKNSIQMDAKLLPELMTRVDHLFYNVCAMAALTAKTMDPTKPTIKPRHLQHLLNYVQKKCYPSKKALPSPQSGGSVVIDSEYFGKESNRYFGETHQNQLDLDFANRVARPEIRGGGLVLTEVSMEIIEFTQKANVFPESSIRDLLKSFGVSIEKAPMKLLKKIIELHLNCLMIDLKEQSPITSQKMEKLFHLKRHAIFF